MMTLEPDGSLQRLLRYAKAIQKQKCPLLVTVRRHFLRELPLPIESIIHVRRTCPHSVFCVTPKAIQKQKCPLLVTLRTHFSRFPYDSCVERTRQLRATCVHMVLVIVPQFCAPRRLQQTRNILFLSAQAAHTSFSQHASGQNGRYRFARLLNMHYSRLAFFCELPPTLPFRTVTSGRFGTLNCCLPGRCCTR